jgi:hypothetical protein
MRLTMYFSSFLCSLLLLTACADGGNNNYEKSADQFSYSVLTSDDEGGLDLLEELNSSVLPKLREAGAQEYAIWSRASDSSNDFEEIAENKLVVMLRWEKINTTVLAEELGAMTNVSDVATSLLEVNLRGGDGPIETGPGFYIHRFNRYLSEDVDQVLSLNEQAWVTWEPFWGGKVVGVWRDQDEVDESNGITRLTRIVWYQDKEHWQETRDAWLEPDSFEVFIERISIQLDDESWSAKLQSN